LFKRLPLPTKVLLFSMLSLAAVTISSYCQADEVAVIKHATEQEQQSQTLSVTLKIDPNKMIPGSSPTAHLYEKYNPGNSYPVTVKVDEKKPDIFDINSGTLPAGSYRLIIDIPVHRTMLGINVGHLVSTLIHDFTVHQRLSDSCFNFNDKAKEVMGWTSSHVYIVDREQPVSKPTCPGLFYVNTSWPAKLNETTQGGSMFVPISSECFPKTSNQMSGDPHWHFSLKSPDLSARPDWQHITSIDFRVATSKIPVKVLPEVHYTIGKTSTSTIFKDVLRKKVEIAGDSWNTVKYPFMLPKEAVVTGVELHFYGVPELTVGNEVNSIFIDGVCPKQ
ncbi:MAG: hypothetical protein PVG20_03430, partial [Thioalkalispiraceae bacterium]